MLSRLTVARVLVITATRKRLDSINSLKPRHWFNINVPSNQYRKIHYRDKTVIRSSNLHNAVPILIRWHIHIESDPGHKDRFLHLGHYQNKVVVPTFDSNDGLTPKKTRSHYLNRWWHILPTKNMFVHVLCDCAITVVTAASRNDSIC